MLHSDPTARTQREIGYVIARPVPLRNPVVVVRLKLVDLIACVVVPMLAVVLLQQQAQFMTYVYVPLIGYLPSQAFFWLALLGTFLAFVTGNALYPEGDLWRVFKRWLIWLRTHDRWSAQVRVEDKQWTPSNLRRVK